MKRLPCLLFGLFALALGPFGVVYADQERPDHFEGKPARTLEEAVEKFSEYNGKLAEILDKGRLGPHELHKVHELTYTLENALEKIHSELSSLAETLERVHVASEHADADTVKEQGAAYLETARKLLE